MQSGDTECIGSEEENYDDSEGSEGSDNHPLLLGLRDADDTLVHVSLVTLTATTRPFSGSISQKHQCRLMLLSSRQVSQVGINQFSQQ